MIGKECERTCCIHYNADDLLCYCDYKSNTGREILTICIPSWCPKSSKHILMKKRG